MANKPFIYIVSYNKKYLTNRANVSALWEVVTAFLEEEKDLEFSYRLEETDDDGEPTPSEWHTELGRPNKIKQLCQNIWKNQLVIHKTGEFDEGDFIFVFQDIVRGKEPEELIKMKRD